MRSKRCAVQNQRITLNVSILDVLLSILYRNITSTGQAHCLKNYKIGTIVSQNNRGTLVAYNPFLSFLFSLFKTITKARQNLTKTKHLPGDI